VVRGRPPPSRLGGPELLYTSAPAGAGRTMFVRYTVAVSSFFEKYPARLFNAVVGDDLVEILAWHLAS